MKLLLILLIGPWTSILRGWVLTLLWRWFVADYFHLPTLRIPIAIGIAILISALTTDPTVTRERHEWYETVTISAIGSMFLLFFGWVAHLFV